MKRVFSAIGVLLLCAVPAMAHHGKDFLIVESFELPHPHDIYFVSSELFSHREDGTFISTEPSLLFGLTHRVAGEVHVHIEKEPGQSLRYEAIAPAVHIQLTPEESKAAWKFALAAEYEIARHTDENNFAARLIAARDMGKGMLVVNIGGEHSRAEGTQATYAVGFRPALDVRVGWGIEAQGHIEHGQQHEVLVGIYAQPGERLTFKAGAGMGLGDGKRSALVRTGIVWRF
jgi:hypothetical protein